MTENKGQFSSDEKLQVPVADLQAMFDPKNIDQLVKLGGVEGLARQFGADLKMGLSRDDQLMEQRKQMYGSNVLPLVPQKSIFKLMYEALQDKTLLLLCAVAFVSLAVGLYQDYGPGNTPDPNDPHWIEGVAIIVTVIIVVLVQSLNDYQKEKKFRQLNAKKEDREVKCIRDGKTSFISVYDVQVGDILHLEPGDVVNVDGVVTESHNLMCDESSATGESDLIRKTVHVEGTEQKSRQDPFLISGSKVNEGVGQFLVTCVGVNSFHGKLMMNLRTEDEPTPLQVKLDQLAENIAKLGAAVSITLLVVLLIKYLIRESVSGWGTGFEIFSSIIDIFIQAIVIIVVAVPEGLPLAVTLALAYGTSRMLSDNNLVRVLSACETMGNATTVCSDKTGTLTQNRMTVVAGLVGLHVEFRNSSGITKLKQKVSGAGNPMDPVNNPSETQKMTNTQYTYLTIESILMNSTSFEEVDSVTGASKFVGSKTETALIEWAGKLGMTGYSTFKNDSAKRIVQVYPFSSEKKCMSTVVKHGQVIRVYTKGASEIILKMSDQIVKFDDEEQSLSMQPIDDLTRRAVQKKIMNFADECLRTIVVAFRDFQMDEFCQLVGIKELTDQLPTEASEKLEKFCTANLCVLALFGIEDPLREGVAEAVAKCQKSGVFVRMVTGDNINTAKAIATKCGILTKGGLVIEGPRFRKLNQEEMDAVIPRLQVLARSSPIDKQILVGRLKALNETVAVTGDGTNDAPALKMADVGFSMGIAGTEVAKEASAIILMDDNFSSILKAMMWGRSVNDSVKKFLQFQLTVNISAVTIAFISACVSNDNESVLTAVQLLWVNLIMDALGALALATDPPTEEILDRQPESKLDPLITVDMWKMILGQSLFQVVANLFMLYTGSRIFGLNEGVRADYLQLKSFVFNQFIFLQLFNQLNCRRIDSKLNIFQGLTKNYFFVPIMIFVVCIQVLIIYVGGLVFSVVPITGSQWAASVLIGVLSLPVGMVIRLLPTSPDGCTICGYEIAKRDQTRLHVTRERMQWQSAIGNVKTQLSVFKALRGTARHSSNSLTPSLEIEGEDIGTPPRHRNSISSANRPAVQHQQQSGSQEKLVGAGGDKSPAVKVGKVLLN